MICCLWEHAQEWLWGPCPSFRILPLWPQPLIRVSPDPTGPSGVPSREFVLDKNRREELELGQLHCGRLESVSPDLCLKCHRVFFIFLKLAKIDVCCIRQKGKNKTPFNYYTMIKLYNQHYSFQLREFFFNGILTINICYDLSFPVFSKSQYLRKQTEVEMLKRYCLSFKTSDITL